MKTLHAVLSEMREKFKTAGLDTPELDARLLVQAILNISHEEIILDSNRIVDASEEKALSLAASRRLAREPVSRIIGMRSFWNSDFKISKETLDPRADSETLVETVLRYVPKDQPLRMIDLGTGSGCLLLSLLQELPQATGIGVDISAEAIVTAQENADILHLSERADFMAASWEAMEHLPLFDIVISNPPYISDAEILTLAPEVRQFDPNRALSGGYDGLDCYRSIISVLPHILCKNGLVFFEIGTSQKQAVTEILAGGGVNVLQTVTDLAGHDRCVVGRI